MKLATSNLAGSWDLSRPVIKSHAKERVGMDLGKGSSPKFVGSPSIFSQWLNLATSNLVHSFDLPRPIIKSHPEESGFGLGLGEFFKILGLPYNISATDGASDFKFDMEARNIWGSPVIFVQPPRCPLSVSGASCY